MTDDEVYSANVVSDDVKGCGYAAICSADKKILPRKYTFQSA